MAWILNFEDWGVGAFQFRWRMKGVGGVTVPPVDPLGRRVNADRASARVRGNVLPTLAWELWGLSLGGQCEPGVWEGIVRILGRHFQCIF